MGLGLQKRHTLCPISETACRTLSKHISSQREDGAAQNTTSATVKTPRQRRPAGKMVPNKISAKRGEKVAPTRLDWEVVQPFQDRGRLAVDPLLDQVPPIRHEENDPSCRPVPTSNGQHGAPVIPIIAGYLCRAGNYSAKQRGLFP